MGRYPQGRVAPPLFLLILVPLASGRGDVKRGAVYAGLATDQGLVETLVHQTGEAPDQKRNQNPISP